MTIPKTPPFLMWQDLKAPLAQRCQDAAAAYARRFGQAPTLLLVPPDAPDPLPAGAERRAGVGVGCVWAGRANP